MLSREGDKVSSVPKQETGEGMLGGKKRGRLWRPLQAREETPFSSFTFALFPKSFPAASLCTHKVLFLIEKIDNSHKNLGHHVTSSLANRSEAHPCWGRAVSMPIPTQDLREARVEFT